MWKSAMIHSYCIMEVVLHLLMSLPCTSQQEEEAMSHPITSIVSGIAVVIISTSWAMAAPDVPPKTTEAFLQKAAAGQQQEIDLGQLATQKAESDEVKQFGARMVTDHQKARQAVQQLARKGGLQ